MDVQGYSWGRREVLVGGALRASQLPLLLLLETLKWKAVATGRQGRWLYLLQRIGEWAAV